MGGGKGATTPKILRQQQLHEERLFPSLVQYETRLEHEEGIRAELAEELIPVQIHPMDPTKTTRIEALLHKDAQDNFKTFLRKNIFVFTWSHEDMPGIDPGVIAHRLNIDPKCHPIKQMRKAFNLKLYEAIKVKVDKLFKAGFIQSVDYLT